MKRSRVMKPVPILAGLLTGLLLVIAALPLCAQPVRQPRAEYYDISKEVTLQGTVSSVLAHSSTGMIAGSHLMVETASGIVDASLGKWAMEGKGALPVATGERVEVTGVMKTLKEKQVFVARTVKVGGQVYELRNKHGVPYSRQSRERASQKTAQKGESL